MSSDSVWLIHVPYTVYTPPNAAVHGFCLYDERTGEAKHIKQTNYYSVRGKRLDDGVGQ